jgi:predicted transposase
MENFFGIMKQEMYYGELYYSYDELRNTIDNISSIIINSELKKN